MDSWMKMLLPKSTQTEEVRNAKHITTKLSTTNVAIRDLEHMEASKRKLPTFQKKILWNIIPEEILQITFSKKFMKSKPP